MKKSIYVTSPSLPDLKDFIPYLEQIWENKWLTNNGEFHQEFEKKLAEYFQVSVDYLVTGESAPDSNKYLLDANTAETAHRIYQNDKVLFDVYCSADKDRLVEYAKKLKELRDLEQTK